MAKRNWFDSIENRVPAVTFDEFNLPVFKNGMNLAKTLLTEPFDLDFSDFDSFGFQDKGDHYEMTTDLGGQRGDSEDPEDAVKVELTGKDNRTVEISYERTVQADNYHYGHTQKTSITLPADADEETVRAFFDDDNDVVVSVKKKAKEPEKKVPRSIPVGIKHKDK